MKIYNTSLAVLLLINLLYLSATVVAAKKRIKICIKQFDMPGTISSGEWENKYKTVLNDYFAEKTKNNEYLKDYTLDIYFYPYSPVNIRGLSVPKYYINDLSYKLRKREYDMVILDERILFSEMALMESDLTFASTGLYYPSFDLLHDLTDYIDMKDLEFHDPKCKSFGIYKDRIVGIPYEFDFDVLYYHHTKNSMIDEDTQLLLDYMKSNSWKDLISQMNKNSQPLQLPLGDDNDLLNFFVEYSYNQYNLSSEFDPDYIKLFYNDTSNTFFTNLRDSINTYTDYEVKNSIIQTLDDAFYEYMKKQTTFFKAKASHNILFKYLNVNSTELPLSLPPMNQSVTTHKYIVANRFSNIHPKLLAEVALILTDKKMQLLRAENLGSIPTFDFSKKDSDRDMKNYCEDNPVICDAMDRAEKLYIRNIFKSKNMIPFIEIECLLPVKIKNYFISNDIEYIKNAFTNMNEFITSNLGFYGTLSCVVTVLVITIFFVIMFITNRLKEHPYIKVISPDFCNLIILGCIFNLVKILKYIPPYSITKIKIFLVLETLGTNLIFVPMFAVSYRIFHILKTRSLISINLYNKRLLTGVLVAISISVIYCLSIMLTNNFYYDCYGSINEPRLPLGGYDNYYILNKIYKIYLYFIVSNIILHIKKIIKR